MQHPRQPEHHHKRARGAIQLLQLGDMQARAGSQLPHELCARIRASPHLERGTCHLIYWPPVPMDARFAFKVLRGQPTGTRQVSVMALDVLQ